MHGINKVSIHKLLQDRQSVDLQPRDKMKSNNDIGKLTVGEKIAYYRKKNNWSQLELSLITGITRDQISRLELDKNSPRLETVIRLEDALNLPRWALLDDLVFDAEINDFTGYEYDEILDLIHQELSRKKLTVYELQIIKKVIFSLVELFTKMKY